MNQPIKRAAQFRNAVISILKEAKEPLVFSQIYERPDIVQIGMTDSQARQLIRDMSRPGGELKKSRTYGHERSRYAYELAPQPKQEAMRVEVPQEVKRKKHQVVGIDIDKDTGSLNIHLEGMSIEIKVK